jgi:hypothetical protein
VFDGPDSLRVLVERDGEFVLMQMNVMVEQ